MQLFAGAPASAAGGDADIIKNGSLKTFAQDVLRASQQVPVLVDFWAPWCGPCKQLTPVLEKVVRAAKGKVRLVKINIDENPELAQQLRIQSVPTVYAFLGGQPVTGFAGAQPESQIKALVDRLIQSMGPLGPDEGDDLLQAAQQAAEHGDTRTAARLYQQILAEDPAQPEALGGLARCLLADGKLAEARQLLEGAPKELANHTAITGAKAALALAEEAGELGDPTNLLARVQANPDDHEARYQIATIMFLRGQIETAMEHLVQIVKRDRAWKDDLARKQLVRFFEALGPKHPATAKGRRMLSSVLFS
ncbi:thioredoxin [Benzoatithermus flavus]|uniref:Thioredoxin n=1 Tax=Benzoatithermus flavus TaxID=3108223 RepID=A0ABU8XNU9_9PROT